MNTPTTVAQVAATIAASISYATKIPLGREALLEIEQIISNYCRVTAQLAAEEIVKTVWRQVDGETARLPSFMKVAGEVEAIITKHFPPQQSLPVKAGELLPCPFCGGIPDVEPHDYAKQGGVGIVYGMICGVCGASTARNYTTEATAKRRWNERNPLPVSGDTPTPETDAAMFQAVPENPAETPQVEKTGGIVEYDGAFFCTICGANWGAISRPDQPCVHAKANPPQVDATLQSIADRLRKLEVSNFFPLPGQLGILADAISAHAKGGK